MTQYLAYLISRDGVPKYVGITKCGIKKRWREHRCSARENASTVLARALRKYGFDRFTVSVIGETETYDALKELEKALIVQYGTKAPNGYNCTDGGDGTEGVLRPGRTISPEHRAALSAANKGKTISPEHRAAISAANKIRVLPPGHGAATSAGMVGLVRTPEHKAKLAAAAWRMSHLNLMQRMNVAMLVRLGAQQTAIAQWFGVSVQVINQVARKTGVSTKRSPRAKAA